MKPWATWAAFLLCLAVHIVLSVLLLAQDSLTDDEPVYMAAGYLAAKDRDLRINREHPPFAKALAGLGLRTGGFSFPYASRGYRDSDPHEVARKFVFQGENDATRMTILARWPILFLSLLFFLFFFLILKNVFGDRPALLALLLYSLSPTVLAHNHLVTTDAPLMVFCFVGMTLSTLSLSRGSPACATAGGICLGLAMLSKFSGLLCIPVITVLGLAALLSGRGQRWRLFGLCFWIGILSLGTILAGCWLLGKHTPGGQGPLWTYLDGLNRVREHVSQGHWAPQFLLGSYSLKGWWYYFPAALALKTSVFFQGLLVLSVIRALRRDRTDKMPQARLVYHALWLFPLCFTAFSMTSTLNLGIRYMMPVLPFLFAFVGVNIHRLVQAGSRPVRIGVLALFAGYTLSTLWSYPVYMGFFTEWARRNPQQFLSDSNIDWGQDLLRLRRFMDQHKIRRIRLDYFGPEEAPDYFLGDRYESWSVKRGFPGKGWFAASEFPIMLSRYHANRGSERQSYNYLDNHEPVARVGSSLRVYFFPDDHQAR